MESFINLLDVIIWPATIIIIILLFKSQLRTVFGRLNKLDANASGISLSFSEKLEATKKLALKLQDKAISKNSPSIHPDNRVRILSEVKAMEDHVREYLTELARKSNISSEGKTIAVLSDALKEQGVIRFDRSQLINAFAELTKNAQGNLLEENMEDLRKIFETIKS